jgi:hypothetical protein
VTAQPFRAWSRCEAPACATSPAFLLVVRDCVEEWPELVDGDGAVRFVLCAEHREGVPAVVRGADGRERAVEVFPT